MVRTIKQSLAVCALVAGSCFGPLSASAQEVLTLQDAMTQGVNNYASIKSKDYQSKAAKETISQSRRDYAPNVVLSGQQVYGTVNGQNGPLYGFGGFGVSSSGLPLPEQTWNAGFGALYLANFNWEVFTFGRAQGRIQVAKAASDVAQSDLQQEQFQHQVRIAAAYLNALGAQKLAAANQKNLERAQVVQQSVTARAKGGLVAGVDSATANAELSNARILLLRSRDLQQEQEKNLAFLIGINASIMQLDTSFLFQSPTELELNDTTVAGNHPVLRFYQNRLRQTQRQLELNRRSYYPSFNIVGVIQTRASGFSSSYAQDQTAYTHSYIDGIKPTRTNYLFGLGLNWNLTTIYRTRALVKSSGFSALASQQDLELTKQQLSTQLDIADTKLQNAVSIFEQTPVQVKSATDAYTQKTALYRNGLTTLIDVTQALYILNRAEIDRGLASINVWQALLLKAAANGDLTLFTNELTR